MQKYTNLHLQEYTDFLCILILYIYFSQHFCVETFQLYGFPIRYIMFLSFSCSMLVCIGPHPICGEPDSDQNGREVGKDLDGNYSSRPEERVDKDDARILPCHPLHSALAGSHRCDLHVRPGSLHTPERTAEAYRGRPQGDHDVLVACHGDTFQ